MKHFIVRLNCEYSLDVDAEDMDDAIAQANEIDCSEWSQSWSCIEAEEEPVDGA